MDRINKNRYRLLWQIDNIDRHSQGTTGIETLEEILGLLRITEEYASCNDLKLELRLHSGKDLRKYKG